MQSGIDRVFTCSHWRPSNGIADILYANSLILLPCAYFEQSFKKHGRTHFQEPKIHEREKISIPTTRILTKIRKEWNEYLERGRWRRRAVDFGKETFYQRASFIWSSQWCRRYWLTDFLNVFYTKGRVISVRIRMPRNRLALFCDRKICCSSNTHVLLQACFCACFAPRLNCIWFAPKLDCVCFAPT